MKCNHCGTDISLNWGQDGQVLCPKCWNDQYNNNMAKRAEVAREIERRERAAQYELEDKFVRQLCGCFFPFFFTGLGFFVALLLGLGIYSFFGAMVALPIGILVGIVLLFKR